MQEIDQIKKKALMQAIEEIPTEEGFKVPDGFPIPLSNRVYVKKIADGTGLEKRESGLLIPTNMSASNSILPDTAIIFACGWKCDDFLFPGLKVMLNPYANKEVMVYGEIYIECSESDIMGILPPKTYVYQGVKSDAYMRREKHLKEWDDYRDRRHIHDLNELDKRTELQKKK